MLMQLIFCLRLRWCWPNHWKKLEFSFQEFWGVTRKNNGTSNDYGIVRKSKIQSSKISTWRLISQTLQGKIWEAVGGHRGNSRSTFAILIKAAINLANDFYKGEHKLLPASMSLSSELSQVFYYVMGEGLGVHIVGMKIRLAYWAVFCDEAITCY